MKRFKEYYNLIKNIKEMNDIIIYYDFLFKKEDGYIIIEEDEIELANIILETELEKFKYILPKIKRIYIYK